MTTESFDVPNEWLGKKVTVSLAIPMPVSGGLAGQQGLGFPEINARLLRVLGGALLLDINGSTVLQPMNRVQNIILVESEEKRPAGLFT